MQVFAGAGPDCRERVSLCVRFSGRSRTESRGASGCERVKSVRKVCLSHEQQRFSVRVFKFTNYTVIKSYFAKFP